MEVGQGEDYNNAWALHYIHKNERRELTDTESKV